MVESVYAYKVINNMDKGCLEFIDKFKDVSAVKQVINL